MRRGGGVTAALQGVLECARTESWAPRRGRTWGVLLRFGGARSLGEGMLSVRTWGLFV